MFYVHRTDIGIGTMIDIFFIVKYVSCNFYIIERFNENPFFIRNASSANHCENPFHRETNFRGKRKGNK